MKLLHAENGGVVLYVNAWKRVCSTCRPMTAKPGIMHRSNPSFGKAATEQAYRCRLNGKIYLIAGNHDIKNLRQNYTKYFEQITMQMHIEVNKQKIYLNHCPFLCYGGAYCGTW